jgi:hypothetical protein
VPNRSNHRLRTRRRSAYALGASAYFAAYAAGALGVASFFLATGPLALVALSTAVVLAVASAIVVATTPRETMPPPLPPFA